MYIKYAEHINAFVLLPKIPPPFLKSQITYKATSGFIQNNVVIEYLQTWSIDDDKGPFKDFPVFKYGAQSAAKERQRLLI